MRGHQEHVRPCFNLVRQGVVVCDCHQKLIRKSGRHVPEKFLVNRVACSQGNNVKVQGRKLPLTGDEVKAFLRHKTRNDADDRPG